MKLEGIHHITAITGDAPGNVEFYVGVLGLRMVKKTVNQDDPTVYHLFYADEHGIAGQRPHVLRVPGRRARAGRARAWSTESSGASPRTMRSTSGSSGSRGDGVATRARRRRAALRRPRGPRRTSWSSSTRRDEPLVGGAPEVPREHALQGFDGVRAYSVRPGAQRAARCARRSGSPAARTGAGRRAATHRGGIYAYDPRPDVRAAPGRRHGPPHRVRHDDGGARGLASSASRAAAPARPR